MALIENSILRTEIEKYAADAITWTKTFTK